MLFEEGEVVAVDPDAVWVETLRRSTCGTCSLQKGCGHGLLNRLGGGRRHLIRVLPGRVSTAECRVGDEVTLALPESVVLRGSVLVYMLPMLAMLLAAAAGAALLPQVAERASLAGALLGFVAAMLWLRWHGRRHGDDPAMQPTLHARRPARVANLAVGMTH